MPTTPVRRQKPRLLEGLGLIGLGDLEPVVVAAVAAELPVLLVGPHGTGKSLLLTRVAEALGLSWRHYKASLLNDDDLMAGRPA
jgi:MoxR-like ATPase